MGLSFRLCFIGNIPIVLGLASYGFWLLNHADDSTYLVNLFEFGIAWNSYVFSHGLSSVYSYFMSLVSYV